MIPRSEEGQRIEVAQVEAVAAMTAEAVPQGIYRTAGDDEWMAISVRDARNRRRLEKPRRYVARSPISTERLSNLSDVRLAEARARGCRSLRLCPRDAL